MPAHAARDLLLRIDGLAAIDGRARPLQLAQVTSAAHRWLELERAAGTPPAELRIAQRLVGALERRLSASAETEGRREHSERLGVRDVALREGDDRDRLGA